MNSDSTSLPVGALLQGGKYKILKVLGQGGFGITYLAEQTGLGMKVAIKEFFLKGSCARDSVTSMVQIPVTDNREMVSRCLKKFKSEARKIASLNNDHIVNIIDVFDENGTSYYVMKYLGGGSLSRLVDGHSLSEERAVKIILEICDALHSVHENGLLHLDIKPANIIFDERGRAVLIDFGVSKYVDSPSDNATTSSLIGFSRGYAPLEQINAVGSTLTPASDIYALGATLFHLLTGHTPPDASVIMNNGLPELPDYLSEGIKEVLRQSMQPRCIDRPQNVEAFMDLLPETAPAPEPVVEETTVLRVVSTEDQEEVAEPPVPPRSNKWPLLLSAAMLVAAIVFFGMGYLKKPASVDDEKANQEVVASRKEAEDLRTQVNTLNSRVRSLEQKNSDLTKENSSLSSSSKRLQAENQRLQKQITDLQGQIKRVLQSK